MWKPNGRFGYVVVDLGYILLKKNGSFKSQGGKIYCKAMIYFLKNFFYWKIIHIPWNSPMSCIFQTCRKLSLVMFEKEKYLGPIF